MGLRRLFTDHPTAIGETYTEHAKVALSYAGPLAVAAVAAALHAIFPFLFRTTASITIRRLNERVTLRCLTCPSGPAHRPDLFVTSDLQAASGRNGAYLR